MAALDRPNAVPSRLGRFELRRVLGQGAQATVWLGYDPRLDREVAVKLMRPGAESADDDASVNQWLQEARSVSRLTHPNIVPVFEADVQEQQPYLVFEYVDGRTLSQTLRGRKVPLTARESVSLMIGVLDALHAAHEAGVVHRDLKPSNVLVDAAGRARVMDFGIAARIAARAGADAVHRIVGTPGYISPEAARGEAPTPAMDIYAAGLVLAEMINGKPVIVERDPYRAIQRAANEQLVLPVAMPGAMDDRLRALLMRAIAHDSAQRLPSAAAMRDALKEWLTPPPAAVNTGGAGGALEFLLRRMRHKSDFPALSDSVTRIERVAKSENESLGSLSSEILKDVALTNKLLRLVNTAHYAQAGGGTISTVSRAVALVGFAGIRNMALSLVLLEHMQDKVHASHLKEEFLRSLMAGSLASQLCSQAVEGEEAFIGAMFQNLGRMLTKFYFPEEARQVEQAMSKSGGAMSEEAASVQALGMSYEDLGLGVARSWGLPDTLQRCMRIPQGEPPTAQARNADRLRWVTLAANEVATTILNSDPSKVQGEIAAVAERYSRVLGVSPKEMQANAQQAREELANMADAMGMAFKPGTNARRLLDPPSGERVSAPVEDTMTLHALQATLPLAETPQVKAPAQVAPGGAQAVQELKATSTPEPAVQQSVSVAAPASVQEFKSEEVVPSREYAANMMAAGIQDITNAMAAESFRLNDVLRMILETMLRALNFRHVVFCLRDPKTDVIKGRLGFGENVEELIPQFRVEMKGGTDLFVGVCHKGVDTLIADSSVPHIATRLPPWFNQHVKAPAFLLMPLTMKGATFALIYADKAQSGGLDLGEKELSLLRTLRNQAVMGFRQAV